MLIRRRIGTPLSLPGRSPAAPATKAHSPEGPVQAYRVTMSAAVGLFVLSGVVFLGLGVLPREQAPSRNAFVGVRISDAVQ